MPRPIALLVIPAVTVLALSGCSFAGARGPAVSQEREIDTATVVVLDTSGDLEISEGEPSLVIYAPASVLEQLTAEVVGGELQLGAKPGMPDFLFGDIRYELSLPSLERIEINGSGDVDSDLPGENLDIEINGSGDLSMGSIDASAVIVEISGSGDVELSGRSTELSIEIDGSADVDAEDLETERVSVEIDGSAEVDVSASDTLAVSISGAGSVNYAGRPQLTQEISGSGEVTSRD